MKIDTDTKALALLAALALAFPVAARALPGDNNAAGASTDPVDGNGIRNSASSQDQVQADQAPRRDFPTSTRPVEPGQSLAQRRSQAKVFDGRISLVGQSVDQAEKDKRLSAEQARKLRLELAQLRRRYLYPDGRKPRRLRAAEASQLDLDIRAQELGAHSFAVTNTAH